MWLNTEGADLLGKKVRHFHIVTFQTASTLNTVKPRDHIFSIAVYVSCFGSAHTFFSLPFKIFLREQTRNQNSMYMRQVSQLESTVSQLRSELREAKRMYEDKVCVDCSVRNSSS